MLNLSVDASVVSGGCTIHYKHGKHWVGFQAKPYTANDGSQSWAKLVDFRDRATGDRFQDQALKAAHAAYEGAAP